MWCSWCSTKKSINRDEVVCYDIPKKMFTNTTKRILNNGGEIAIIVGNLLENVCFFNWCDFSNTPYIVQTLLSWLYLMKIISFILLSIQLLHMYVQIIPHFRIFITIFFIQLLIHLYFFVNLWISMIFTTMIQHMIHLSVNEHPLANIK